MNKERIIKTGKYCSWCEETLSDGSVDHIIKVGAVRFDMSNSIAAWELFRSIEDGCITFPRFSK